MVDIDSMIRSNDWMLSGTHGGNLVKSAEAALSATGSDTTLCLDVLDAVYGHENLVTAMASRSWIDDVKFGRLGGDYDEERIAIATNAVEVFTEHWPSMRVRLRNALVVSLVSTMENYVLSLLVEFSPVIALPGSALGNVESRDESAWARADNAYRKTVRSCRSTSGAWVKLVQALSVPDAVKKDVEEWHRYGHGQAIDEMVQVRNAIVHRSGKAGPTLSRLLAVAVNDRVTPSQERWERYERACGSLLVSIDPSF